ncbi:LamB/YcsF family protein [Arthrobacter sp. MW3 TE3886]|uniref:LamB/YcsF family protein n=1 Tax=Arthrobacter sp. MW3 TE3886 TaxID=3156254 RepID=UPI0035161449
MPAVALIADVGESFGSYTMGDDAGLLELISDANVACGFHAGDPLVIERTVRLCEQNGVSLGAHPGFPDLAGFGRRAMALTRDEIRSDILYQLGALEAFSRGWNLSLGHVTIHGKLDNMAGTNHDYASAIVEAIARFDRSLIVVAQSGELERVALAEGLDVAYAFMADRAYESDGQPVSRDRPGAVLHNSAEIAERAIRVIQTGTLESIDGESIPMLCDGVLVHGDTPEAVENARLLRARLVAAGICIEPLTRVLASRKLP